MWKREIRSPKCEHKCTDTNRNQEFLAISLIVRYFTLLYVYSMCCSANLLLFQMSDVGLVGCSSNPSLSLPLLSRPRFE